MLSHVSIWKGFQLVKVIHKKPNPNVILCVMFGADNACENRQLIQSCAYHTCVTFKMMHGMDMVLKKKNLLCDRMGWERIYSSHTNLTYMWVRLTERAS